MNTLTDFQATCLCATLAGKNASVPALRVHSVFQRACNLLTPQGELWVLQAQGMPLAPAGIVVNSSDLLPFFSQGESVHMDDKGELRGRKLRISLNNAVVCSTRLTPCADAAAPALLAQQIAAFFARQPAKGIRKALLSDEKLILAHRALIHWLHGGEGHLTEILTAFIGRGEGLTPAGDDFLLGVLLVLEREGSAKLSALKAALPCLLSRTTDISRAMLEQGCRGHYGALLLRLMTANPPSLVSAVAQVADYGHSSGQDMLSGILTAARASGENGVEAALHVGPL